jgi:hypothetical protein
LKGGRGVHFSVSFLLKRFMLNISFNSAVVKWSTVKSVLSSHPMDQKLVAVWDRWRFRTDCFNRECTAEGQKQNCGITQMAVQGRWPLGQIWLHHILVFSFLVVLMSVYSYEYWLFIALQFWPTSQCLSQAIQTTVDLPSALTDPALPGMSVSLPCCISSNAIIGGWTWPSG